MNTTVTLMVLMSKPRLEGSGCSLWQGLIFGRKSEIWIACEVSDL